MTCGEFEHGPNGLISWFWESMQPTLAERERQTVMIDDMQPPPQNPFSYSCLIPYTSESPPSNPPSPFVFPEVMLDFACSDPLLQTI
jgi:hypothetical protein